MLKYLIKKGYVNVNKVLLENYLALKINETELVVIMKLFEMLKNNQVTVTETQLAKKTSLSVGECAKVLTGLFDRGLISINLEYTKQGKTKESFNLDELINRLNEIFIEEKRANEVIANENIIKDFVSLLEQAFKRSLTNLELDIIVDWVNNGETLADVQKALALAIKAGKMNIRYIDSCLVAIHKKSQETIALDEEKSKILADFYRKIK